MNQPAKPNDSPSTGTTVGMLLAHGVAWAPVVFLLYVYLPSQMKVFRDFQMKLPVLVEQMFALSQLVVGNVALVPVVAGVLVGIDAFLLGLLNRPGGLRVLAWAWFILVIALAAAITTGTMVAVGSAVLTLHDALRG